MSELTYILGAGASYQSMPIVKTFPERFNSFVESLRRLDDSESTDSYIKDSLTAAYSHSLRLSTEFKSHQSFDTYFKKLFHTKPSEIKRAKKLLNLYFIWEHSKEGLEKPHDENLFWKQSKYDKRYDALFAGLLRPVKDPQLYWKTNFITWNYDMNLLCSIKNYFYPQELFRVFMDKIKTNNPNIWNINDQITVINMNGYFYTRHFDEEYSLDTEKTAGLVKHKIIQKNYLDNDVEDVDADYIKFAWETNGMDTNMATINLAREKIKVSDNIVVIGYTFPLYNRLVDLNYFKGDFLQKKTLYIQDPRSKVIAGDIEEGFSISKGVAFHGYTTIKPLTDCDSFFVPNNIFTEPPPKKSSYTGILGIE
jgi:hypothetical protein